MAEMGTVETKIDALRNELLVEIEELREEVRLLKHSVQVPSFVARPFEKRLASVDKLREFRKRVLHHRGGELLPSSAEEIAKMREERTTQILGG